jgi:AMP nucleosidase
MSSSVPPFIAPASFEDPAAALEQLRGIYDASVAHLRDALQRFVAGETQAQHVRACYPFVRVHTETVARADSRLSYGFVAGPGTYETTLTRPDLFGDYYLEQFRLLLQNTTSRWRSAPAHSPFRCTSRWPRTTISRARSTPAGAC